MTVAVPYLGPRCYHFRTLDVAFIYRTIKENQYSILNVTSKNRYRVRALFHRVMLPIGLGNLSVRASTGTGR